MTNATILYFHQRATTLSLKGDNAELDDAIGMLAAWMEEARDHLNSRDWQALGDIGGILYREGLRRRVSAQVEDEDADPVG